MTLSRTRLYWLLGAVLLLGGGVAAWFLWPAGPPAPPALKLEGVDPAVAAALQKARAAVEAEPRSAKLWGELGELFLANDFLAESVACLAQAERLEPGRSRWPYLQGYAYLRAEPDAAVAPLTRAVERDRQALEPRLRLAETLLERTDDDAAEEHFLAALELSPGNPRALLGLGQIAQHRGRWAESIRPLEQAAASPFARKAGHTALAVAHAQFGDEAAAERHRQEADDAPRDPAWPDDYLDSLPGRRMGLTARVDQADALVARQQYEPAVRLLLDVLRDHPKSDEARLKLAQIHIRTGRPDLAEQELRRLTAEHPDLPDGRFLLGMVLLDGAGREAEAEAEFRKAIEARPGFALAYYNLGRCLQKQGKPGPARRAYEDALRHRPQLVIAHVALARLLREQADPKAAREHLLQAQRLAPDDAEVRKLLEEKP